jgi:hypothetical protein
MHVYKPGRIAGVLCKSICQKHKRKTAKLLFPHKENRKGHWQRDGVMDEAVNSMII